MNKKTIKSIIIWLILFCGGFGCGYWLDEWANQRSFRAKFYSSLEWAIEEGILSVNQERLAEMGEMDGALDGIDNCETNDTNAVDGSGMETTPSRNP